MSDKHLICPVCEADTLAPITFTDFFQHGGREISVADLEGYECPHCGADPIFEDQIRRNHARIADAKRKAGGLLTGSEIKALRERLRLTQKEAADLFGGGANAFSKYERGDVAQSVAMDRLLRLVERHPELLVELRGGGPEVLQTAAANDASGYVSGNLVRMSAKAYRSPICRERTVVVEMEAWKQSRNVA
jgi:HTH-type transcriptional regulator / antitoxin MqsA